MKVRTLLAVAASVLLSVFATSDAASAAGRERTDLSQAEKRARTTEIQLLGLSEFHGALEPPSGSGGRIGATNAGGVEFLATHLKMLEASNPNTLIVSSGDLVGATPLLSALFHDEPTIEAANLFGLDFTSVGNHEFDEGTAELRRMQEGGCHPVDGCQDGDGFEGADFQYLSANVTSAATGETFFPPYAVVHFKGVKIALIGVTLEATPTIVTPAGVAGLEFADEADTVNALVPKLKRQGVETIIVLIHEGGSAGSIDETTINQCNNPMGALVDVVDRMSDEVDVVLSGHSVWAPNCVIDGKIVVSAAGAGRLISDIDLTVSRASKEVVRAVVDNRIVTRDVAPDPAQTALLAKYQAVAAPIANRVVGSITADITRAANAAGESALGDVIADAQLAATAPAGFGDAVVAFMNPGGIRDDLLFDEISGSEAPGQVTYGELFNVQPFGNSLVTMTLTGSQIEQLLERQWEGQPFPRILQVSQGFSYAWDPAGPIGNRVDPASIMLNGAPVDPVASYRVTVNSFLADGGDNFTVLREGTNRLGGDVDLDALEKYVTANSPVAPGPQNRIALVP